MATVYKGHDTLLERDVAVKIIRSAAFPEDLLDENLKRFAREAKSLAKLSHPNIVKVYDYGEHDGSPYLVMEYLPGGTLKKFLDRPVPWQEAVHLLLPIARGVAYAHQHGILHRDIKPANILLTDSGEPMLSDFGIAKLFEGNQTAALTGSGVAIGTPEYMAPEQWTGITSPQSDLYSMAVVLYELVAGRKPYVADTPAGFLIKQAMEPLPSPRTFTADLPEAAEQVLIKALAREPRDRYADVNTLVGALENLQLGAMVAPITEPKEIKETRKDTAQKSEISSSPDISKPHDGESIRFEQVSQLQAPAEPTPPSEHFEKPPESQRAEKSLVLPVQPEKVTGHREADKSLPSPIQREKFPSPRRAFPSVLNLIVIGSLCMFAVGIGLVFVWLLGPGIPLVPASTTIATVTFTLTRAASTPTALTPSVTASPNPNPTDAANPTMTPLPAQITDFNGAEMVLVSAGEFSMGDTIEEALAECQRLFPTTFADNCKAEYFTDETPPHKVDLAAYYIDKYEVTNALYKACVDAGVCMKPVKTNSETHPAYYGMPGYSDYPVIWVNWNMAKKYCEWRDARLPTEAEWEKAARGGSSQNYPWGNTLDGAKANFCDTNCSKSHANKNFNDGYSDVAPANAFSDGASIYNIFNLSGNVSEWVADWYSPDTYSLANGLVANPSGPSSGTAYVIRGGSWLRFPVNLRSVTRSSNPPEYAANDLGIRCVRDALP